MLGVGVGDDVITESRGRVVRLRLEGTSVHVSEKVVNFHLWGMRYRKDGLPGNSVVLIAPDPDGQVWVATRTGVARFAYGEWIKENPP